jgi:RHS repeat-associated protein
MPRVFRGLKSRASGGPASRRIDSRPQGHPSGASRFVIAPKSFKLLASTSMAMCLMLGLIAIPSQALAAAGATKLTAAAPQTFVPDKINRTPVGGPIPDDAGGAEVINNESSVRLTEAVERRTESSKTFRTEDGHMVTDFFAQPVNYRDEEGKWQTIDNELVAGKDDNAPIRNAANEFDLSLPATLTGGPARIDADGQFVEFSLKSATSPGPSEDVPVARAPDPAGSVAPSATPSVAPASSPEEDAGTAESSPEDVASPRQSPEPDTAETPPSTEGSVDAEKPSNSKAETVGAIATYPNAFAGVDAVYTSTSEGLKEELILAGPDAPSTYDFSLNMSSGLKAETTSTGGVAFTGSNGKVWGEFAAPFVHDASYPGSTPLDGAALDVKLQLIEQEGKSVVRLSLEESWLKDPIREFPVTADPSLWVTGVNNYTFITSAAPTSNFDSYTSMAVYGAPTPYRMLVKPLPDLVDFFREPVEILTAAVLLNTQFDSTGAAVKPVGVYEMNAEWSASQATWNQRKTGVNWSTPGGTFAAQPDSVVANITGPPGSKGWSVLSMVQAWMRGDRPYNGTMVKYVNDSVASPPIYFDPNVAIFTIGWIPQLGLHDPFSYMSVPIGESRQALVNIAGGSLKLTETDVSLAGNAGLDAVVQRGYDSRSFNGSNGPGWQMWPQAKEKVEELADGDVIWAGGPEQYLLFDRNPDGSFRSPQGYRGSLVKTPGVPNAEYVITLDDSGLKYSFGNSGRPSSITDQNGNKIVFNYTLHVASGEYLMTSLTDTKLRVTTFEHNGPSRTVSKITDPAGRTRLYGYTGDRLTSYTDAAGKITRYEHMTVPTGAVAPISKIIDPNLNETRFVYALARDTQTTPIGYANWDFTYRVTSLTRVTDLGAGTGPTWTFDYSVPHKTKVKSPNPLDVAGTTYSYDHLGRVTESVDALGGVVKTGYTASGFVKDTTNQAGDKAVLTYYPDGLDNVWTATSPMGTVQSTTYDTAKIYYPKTTTNSQGNSVTSRYTAEGNRDRLTNELPAENIINATYNNDPLVPAKRGTVATTTDGVGNVTTFDYYATGELQKINKPLGVGSQTFEYDTLSRVNKITDAKGQITLIGYDAMDRVTSTTFDGGSSIVNVFDDAGRLTRRDDKSGPGLLDPVETTLFGYDRLNRQITKTTPTTSLGLLGSVTFTSVFDGVGNLMSLTDTTTGTPKAVAYEYDAVNRLKAVVEPGGARTTYDYDAAYRRNKITYPNGVTQTTVYDKDGKVTSIVGAKGPTVLTSFTYNYVKPATGSDPAIPTDLVYETVDSSGTTTFKYDEMERLTEAATPGGTFNFTLDGNANRIRSSNNGTTETRYAVNKADQLCYSEQGPGSDIPTLQQTCAATTNPVGASTYQFDLNGNLTGQSDGRTLGYNSKDQNITFKPGGALAVTTEMAYVNSGQTERTQAGGSTYKDGPLGLASNSSGPLGPLVQTTTDYIRDPEGGLVSLRNGSTSYYYLFDRLGSVVALTDAAGVAVNKYFYDPFGNYLVNTVEAVANPWQFAGGFKDAFSGYYKFGARYYDPVIGRWTQPDPSGQDANSYAYAGGNPANFVDPSGLAFWKTIKKAAGKAWKWAKAPTWYEWAAYFMSIVAYGGCIATVTLGSAGLGTLGAAFGCAVAASAVKQVALGIGREHFSSRQIVDGAVDVGKGALCNAALGPGLTCDVLDLPQFD